MANYIEFLHSANSKKIDKETIHKVDNLKAVLHFIGMRKFTGVANVYSQNNLLYTMACENGVLHGSFTKYIDYVPSTWGGLILGYVSRNWRQPEIELKMRNGMIDSQVIIYKNDASRHFVLNYSMGLLQGEQKHYISSFIRVIHTFEKGVWKNSYRQYKNWIPRWEPEVDDVISHKEIKATSVRINDLFVR
jgi:antitoxin component YwqK of YwqJK toxin-antitoxin module